jgi:hypothetical protein
MLSALEPKKPSGERAAPARKTFVAPSPLAVNLLVQLGVGVVFVAAFALFGALEGRGFGPLASITFFAYLALYLLPKRVVTGADGFRIGWLGRGRFIPYSRVARAYQDNLGVIVDLRSGSRVRLQYDRQFNLGLDILVTLFENQKAKVVERIDQGALRHAHAGADRDAGGLLARQGRTPIQWLDALRALGSADAREYRAAAMAPDLLWRIAENAAAPPEDRAAAAVALYATLDDEGRVRLRGLARETAAPKVRVALEAAASSNDPEELARALSECEEVVVKGE